MKLKHLINVQSGQSLQKNVLRIVKKYVDLVSIHNHPNGIVADLSTGQTDNEVHDDVFPLPFWYR